MSWDHTSENDESNMNYITDFTNLNYMDTTQSYKTKVICRFACHNGINTMFIATDQLPYPVRRLSYVFTPDRLNVIFN